MFFSFHLLKSPWLKLHPLMYPSTFQVWGIMQFLPLFIYVIFMEDLTWAGLQTLKFLSQSMSASGCHSAWRSSQTIRSFRSCTAGCWRKAFLPQNDWFYKPTHWEGWFFRHHWRPWWHWLFRPLRYHWRSWGWVFRLSFFCMGFYWGWFHLVFWRSRRCFGIQYQCR